MYRQYYPRYGYYGRYYPYRRYGYRWYYPYRRYLRYRLEKREKMKRKKEHPLAEGFYYIAERISERLSSDSGMGR
jgi:hypothetical protein